MAEPFALPPGRGRLRPLGGLVLDRAAIGFGGISGLALAPDLTLTAVSDRGRWWTAPLLLAGGVPVGLGPLRSGPLRDSAGLPLPRGFLADAEALAAAPEGGWYVAFEGRHRLVHYADLDGPGRPLPAPPGLAQAPGNGGIEALAVLADGRLIALAEHYADAADPSLRWAWIGAPGAW
ncbi:MAG: esterase-like activity of phytase family protein, partial [Rhodovarius sp.]|nr:esterase-like activity of phytase family protein [Rhodovarius sp.]